MTCRNRRVNPSPKMSTIGNATLATSLRQPAGGARRRGSQTHVPATGQASCPSDRRCAASVIRLGTRPGHVVFRPSGPLLYTKSMITLSRGLEHQWRSANRYVPGSQMLQMTNHRASGDLHNRMKGSRRSQPVQTAKVPSMTRYAGADHRTKFL